MAISTFNKEMLDLYTYYIEADMDTDDKRNNTKIAYVSDTTQFLEYIGETKCTDAKFMDANEWVRSLTNRKGEPVAPSTRNRKIAAINGFYTILIEENYVERNPFSRVKLEKLKKGKKGNQITREMLDSNEVSLLRNELEKEVKNPSNERGRNKNNLQMMALRDRAIINLLLNCGLRVEELCGMRINELYEREDGKGVITIPEERDKNKKGRDVPMSDRILTYIHEYRENIWFDCDSNYVFLTQNGSKLSANDVLRIIQKYVERAGIKKHITPHSLRHTAATLMVYSPNANYVKIAQWLGHSVEMLLKTYVHQTEDSLEPILE